MPPASSSGRFIFSAAGFMATSALGRPPGVRMSLEAKWIWKAETPARVPAGARISAGKSGSVTRSLPISAVAAANRLPASCMPSPESPAKRTTTRSFSSRTLVKSLRSAQRSINDSTHGPRRGRERGLAGLAKRVAHRKAIGRTTRYLTYAEEVSPAGGVRSTRRCVARGQRLLEPACPRRIGTRDRARLSHLRSGQRSGRRRPAGGQQPGPGCSRADHRQGRPFPPSASDRRLDRRRGRVGSNDCRHPRARRVRQRPRPEGGPGAGPLRDVLQHVQPLPRRHAHGLGGALAMRAGPACRPFADRGRRAIGAILVTFALFSALSVTLSIWATKRSQNQASVVEVAARQRTLAERYVSDTLLVRSGKQADPRHTGSLLMRSARALLDGGVAPPVNGDD